MSDPFDEIKRLLSDGFDCDSEEIQEALNKIILGAISGIMSNISKNAKQVYATTVTQNQMVPQKHEVLAIQVKIPVPLKDQLMNGSLSAEMKTYFFTADFLQNVTDYLRFLHLQGGLNEEKGN